MGNYTGLVVGIILLLAGFLLAFGALTIIWRRHWETLGPAESLLARLAAAVLLGAATRRWLWLRSRWR